MNTAILRSRILDLAIRGQLVPQDPNEGTADDLLKAIVAQRGKAITPITDNVPFEIPANWRWVKLGDIAINRDSERIPISSIIRNKQSNRIYDYYGATGPVDKVNDYIFDERLLLIGEDGANLLSRSKNNAFFAEGKYWVNNHAHILDCEEKTILDYIAFYINSISLEEYVTGSAQPKLSQGKMNIIPIPLPPLPEQRRIVAKVEELLGEVDKIEHAQTDITQAATILRSRVLDMAIHGQLVPQDPNEGTAMDLLKEIAHQRGKAITPITDNVPFSIPDNWCWVKLGDILRKMQTIKPKGETFLYVDIDAIDNKHCVIRTPKLINTKEAPSRASRYTQRGDVLFSMVRPYLKNIALIGEDGYIASTGFYVCSPINIDSLFLYFMMTSRYVVDGLNCFMKGDNSPSIRANQLEGYLIPLPPLSEQRRIVAKIEELFAEIDKLIN